MVQPQGFVLIRSPRRCKTMTLRIDRQGRVVIRAPNYTFKREIERFFEQNRSWVAKKLAERRAIERQSRPKKFVSGEEFLFLGKSYPLHLAEETEETSGKIPTLSLSSRRFRLPRNYAAKARDLFIMWYKAKAWEIITERVLHVSKKLGLTPRGTRIMTARSQWGSCWPDNSLSFNWKLVMARLPIIDYVVAHELFHIKEKNHSHEFWAALESFMPDYTEHKAWLDNNGHLLNI